ncbi:MAG: hypothetical protein JWO88_693 [Frankiales bacterium]|nr:hypothetical protein [Frankiales bacterium]
MTDNKPGLTEEELEAQDGEQLPDREQMSSSTPTSPPRSTQR